MVTRPDVSRVYIVYQHSLFAEGIRSLLQNQSAVHIIGAEKDGAKALKNVKALKPSVILIEESPTDPQQSTSWDMLHCEGVGRVVTLNLDRSAATVYDRESVPISTPVDLLHTVQGFPHTPAATESTGRSRRGPRVQAASRAKPSVPRGKSEPRKDRA